MGMIQHRWDDDQHILDDLSDALREAALAGTIAEYGKGAYAWRTVDQDLLLASLSFDSSLERVQERRADPDDPRVLVFTAWPTTPASSTSRACRAAWSACGATPRRGGCSRTGYAFDPRQCALGFTSRVR
jgi:hypothetical protein